VTHRYDLILAFVLFCLASLGVWYRIEVKHAGPTERTGLVIGLWMLAVGSMMYFALR